jgi:hypothetical protein
MADSVPERCGFADGVRVWHTWAVASCRRHVGCSEKLNPEMLSQKPRAGRGMHDLAVRPTCRRQYLRTDHR